METSIRDLKSKLLNRISVHPQIHSFAPFFKKSRRSQLLNHGRDKMDIFTIKSISNIILAYVIKPMNDDGFIALLSRQYYLDGREKDLFQRIMFVFGKLFDYYNKEISKYMKSLLETRCMEKVLSLYRDHLTPRIYEKKNLGQVYTPFHLVNQILDKIPLKVWKNKNSRFFDPAAGMGGFLIMVYERLMMHLKKVIPDEKERHDHVIQNMLYASEIDGYSVELMKKVFGPKLHVHHGDTLSKDILQYFNVKGFDVIIGNPPFEKMQYKDSKRNGGDSLWIDFVFESFSKWLVSNGYFGMLLPPGWRKPTDEKSRSKLLWEMMSIENTPLWIHMYDETRSKNSFEGNACIRFDLVVCKKRPNYGFKSEIIQTNGDRILQKINNMPFLPNGNLDYWCKLFNSKNKKKAQVFSSRSLFDPRRMIISREKNAKFKHPIVHAIHKDGTPVFIFTDKKYKEGGFGLPKVIFNEFGGWNKPLLDIRGKYGVSNHAFAIMINSEEEGKKIIAYFSEATLTKYQQDMSWATSKPSIFWKLFNFLPEDFYNSL